MVTLHDSAWQDWYFLRYLSKLLSVFKHRSGMNKLRYFVEQQAFGVCTRIGEKINISASSIRLYFIYTSFLTFGSPVIVYFILAFWLELKKHVRRNAHPTIWEL